MRQYKFVTTDVFTRVPFGGNQLAVFPDAEGLAAGEMQQIAKEFNISETVFVLPPKKSNHDSRFRIFTPAVELPFAGHPTIGAVAVLVAHQRLKVTGSQGEFICEEGVGPVAVRVDASGKLPFVQLTAAKQPEFRESEVTDSDIATVLGLGDNDIGSAKFQIESVSCGVPFTIVPVRSLEAMSKIRLQRAAWEKHVAFRWAPNIYAFNSECKSVESHFHVRMFAPALGVDEDPATGAAATAFGGYLARYQSEASENWSWRLEQGLEMGRPSEIFLTVSRDHSQQLTICVGGYSVVVSEGKFNVP